MASRSRKAPSNPILPVCAWFIAACAGHGEYVVRQHGAFDPNVAARVPLAPELLDEIARPGWFVLGTLAGEGGVLLLAWEFLGVARADPANATLCGLDETPLPRDVDFVIAAKVDDWAIVELPVGTDLVGIERTIAREIRFADRVRTGPVPFQIMYVANVDPRHDVGDPYRPDLELHVLHATGTKRWSSKGRGDFLYRIHGFFTPAREASATLAGAAMHVYGTASVYGRYGDEGWTVLGRVDRFVTRGTAYLTFAAAP